jgi:hypothetical protein
MRAVDVLAAMDFDRRLALRAKSVDYNASDYLASLDASAHVSALIKRERVLREALRQCADALEMEIEARRAGEVPHRIELDLEVVRRARAALALCEGGAP